MSIIINAVQPSTLSLGANTLKVPINAVKASRHEFAGINSPADAVLVQCASAKSDIMHKHGLCACCACCAEATFKSAVLGAQGSWCASAATYYAHRGRRRCESDSVLQLTCVMYTLALHTNSDRFCPHSQSQQCHINRQQPTHKGSHCQVMWLSS